VAPGGTVTVTITHAGSGGIGAIIETLPAGFTYDDSSLDAANVINQPAAGTVRFILFEAPSPFTYTVTAPNTPGDGLFSGMLRLSPDDEPLNVGGDNRVTVEAPTSPAGPSASRSISPRSVAPGGTVTVTITHAGSEGIGAIIETLPTGFTYDDTSLDAVNVSQPSAGTVRFSLFQAPSPFTYTVTAPNTPGDGEFSGILRLGPDNTPDVGGDSEVTVEGPTGPAGPSASRSISGAERQQVDFPAIGGTGRYRDRWHRAAP
jgi:predicted RNA-binding protein with TRAM domain